MHVGFSQSDGTETYGGKTWWLPLLTPGGQAADIGILVRTLSPLSLSPPKDRCVLKHTCSFFKNEKNTVYNCPA